MEKIVLRKQQQLRKKDKKGFTLVELIVVIAILGILMAIAIPSLVGYIQKAQNEGASAEARTAQVAIQTVISEAAGTGTYVNADGTLTILDFTVQGQDIVVADGGGATSFLEAINRLTGAPYTNLDAVFVDQDNVLIGFTIIVPTSGATVTWSSADGYIVS